MTVRELIFSYKSKNAKKARQADKKVQDQIQETGQVADQESNRVERWMSRNKAAITATASAAAGAMGAILSSSSRMRAELSGVQSAFGLFADTVVSDLLPGTGSLAGASLTLAQSFRDLTPSTRALLSALIAVAGVAGAVLLAFGAIPAAVAAVVVGVALLLEHFGLLDDYFKWIMGWINLFIKLAKGDFSEAWNQVAGAVEDAIMWSITEGPGVLAEAHKEYRGLWKDFGKWAVNNIPGMIKSAIEAAATWLKEEGPGVIKDGIGFVKDALVNGITGVGSAVGDAFTTGWNAAVGGKGFTIDGFGFSIPDWVPGAGGKSFSWGGFSATIPKLQSGGRILSEGIAMLHAGEQVVPSADVDRNQSMGGGSTTIVFEEGSIVIQGTGNSREDGRQVGQEASEFLEKSVGSRGA